MRAQKYLHTRQRGTWPQKLRLAMYTHKIGFQSKIWNSKYWINWLSWNNFQTRSLGSGDRVQLERRKWKFTTKIVDFESHEISNSWIHYKSWGISFQEKRHKTGSVTHLCRRAKKTPNKTHKNFNNLDQISFTDFSYSDVFGVCLYQFYSYRINDNRFGYWFWWFQKNGKNAKKRNDINLENIWSKMLHIIAQ